MTRKGNTSTIEVHPARAEIEAALSAGEPYRSISAKYGVSRSALSRFSLSRHQLARIADDEPNVTTILPRLSEIADDARDLRRLTRVSGNPPARARAIKVETEALTTLANHLGIDDLAVARVYEQTGELVHALREYAESNPEGTRALIQTLRAHPLLDDLAYALKRRLANSND